MENLTTAKVQFEFEAGLVNNESMSIKIISSADDVLCLDNLCQGSNLVELEIIFPSKVIIEVSGKKQFDTQVDEDGNIIADKFIKLSDINVDGLSVNEYYLPRFIHLQTQEHGTITSNYFGFNGAAEIDFSPTPFQWLAGTKRL